jgi:predicted  nucleic acid-binding Zn-ribbon protein
MNPFEMVIGIVFIVTIGSIVRAKYGARRDRHGNEYFVGNTADNAETKALQTEIRALKDRIQVLERIATDHNRAASLDEEIEKLRDRSIP